MRRRLRVRRIGFLLRLRDRVDAPELESPGVTGEDRASLWRVHCALEEVGVNARIAWVFRYLEQESVDDVARLCAGARRRPPSGASPRLTGGEKALAEVSASLTPTWGRWRRARTSWTAGRQQR